MSDDTEGYLRFLPAIYGRRAPGDAPSFLERYLRIPESFLGARDATAEGVQLGMAPVLDVLPALLYPRLSFLFPGSDVPMPPIVVESWNGTVNEAATAANLRLLNDYLGIVPVGSTGAQDPGWEGLVKDWLAQYLDWLASWVAFVPDAGWSVDDRRRALAGVMLLYRRRGTRTGIEDMLRLFVPDQIIQVQDLVEAPPLELGVGSTLAGAYREGDGVLDGSRPFSFAVLIVANDLRPPHLLALEQTVRALVDAEKPLHTRYTVRIESTFTLGKYSTIGVDTRIPISGKTP